LLFFIICLIKLDPVEKISLSSSNLKQSITFWKQILEMTLVEETPKTALLEYQSNQTKLELIDIGSTKS
jgi:catechol-2,3-dioxygenase